MVHKMASRRKHGCPKSPVGCFQNPIVWPARDCEPQWLWNSMAPRAIRRLPDRLSCGGSQSRAPLNGACSSRARSRDFERSVTRQVRRGHGMRQPVGTGRFPPRSLRHIVGGSCNGPEADFGLIWFNFVKAFRVRSSARATAWQGVREAGNWV